MSKITFILGGARSGKSAYAEQLATKSVRPKVYLATAEALDDEMRARIAQHQQRRAGWETVEAPLDIARVITAYPDSIILVDCLTLWLSNLIHHGRDIVAETEIMLDALAATRAQVLLVSNEVGQGIVPDNALARHFRDAAGILHQRVAAAADRVVWVVAAIPTTIKGPAHG